MNLIKNKVLIIYILSVVFIFCTAAFVFILPKYINVKNEIDKYQISDTSLTISSQYINDNEKYSNDEIIPNSYITGFLNDYEYRGIHVLSSVDGWGAGKTLAIGKELFENTHGSEIHLIEAIVLNEGPGGYCTGSYEKTIVYYDAPISLYNLFPENCMYYYAMEKGILTVSNVTDKLDTPDIAQALSVAYGYHFNDYYMGIDGKEDDKDTEYYKLRAAGSDEIRVEITDNDDYMDNEKWYLQHIAAYDYMYLMGSENANRIITKYAVYPQRKSSLEQAYRDMESFYRNALNVTPHINVAVDLPHSVDGLADYFYSFVEEKPREYKTLEATMDFNLSLKYENEFEYQTYKLLIDPPFDTLGVTFSVLKYDMDDNLEIYQTVYSRDQSGMYTYLDAPKKYLIDRTFYTFDMRTIQEFKVRVIASFPNGSIIMSEPITVSYPDEYWIYD